MFLYTSYWNIIKAKLINHISIFKKQYQDFSLIIKKEQWMKSFPPPCRRIIFT